MAISVSPPPYTAGAAPIRMDIVTTCTLCVRRGASRPKQTLPISVQYPRLSASRIAPIGRLVSMANVLLWVATLDPFCQ